MKTLFAAFIGTTAVLGALGSSTVTQPAYALGDCGPNGHRNPWGRCVFRGQNQAYCLRHTGHVSAYVGFGRRRCF